MDSGLQKTEKQNPGGRCKCTTLHLPAGALDYKRLYMLQLNPEKLLVYRFLD